MPRAARGEVQRGADERIGLAIEQIRKRRKLGAKEFAKRIGITYVRLYNYETGRVSIPAYLLPLVARELRVDVGLILRAVDKIQDFRRLPLFRC